jgi:hypothetical protein
MYSSINRLAEKANQAAARRGLTATVVAVFCLASPTLGADPSEVIIHPVPQRVPPLTAQEKQRVQQAVDRGIIYLKRTQLPTGSWIIGKETLGNPRGRNLALYYAAGFAALGGLALLESGVPADDTAVQAAARFVRQSGPGLHRTYDLALAVLFLDRLGDARDLPLVRSLALRLVAGQTAWGGWGYNCPLLNRSQEKKLEKALGNKTRADLPKQALPPTYPKGRATLSTDRADNSNTQFALLALGAVRRHGLPLDYPLGLVEMRFRFSENATGWEYQWMQLQERPRGYGSMTCAGLLGLAVGRGAAQEKSASDKKDGQARPEDAGIAWGLKVLSAYLRDPTDSRYAAADPTLGPPKALNLYFLWSVERVGVLCGVDTIGGIDWYRWGAGLLLTSQRRDGSWLGRGSCGYPAADTCFALLFLKRSDLLPDLRKELAKRVKIVDPGPFTKADLAKKGSKGKKGTDLPDLKALVSSTATADKDGPLSVDLGEVQAGKAIAKPLRVRGPASFRITSIRGGDARLKVKTDSLPAKVHNLTLTLHLDKAGPFEYTLYLQTDLPGRAEVAVRVRVTATPGAGR